MVGHCLGELHILSVDGLKVVADLLLLSVTSLASIGGERGSNFWRQSFQRHRRGSRRYGEPEVAEVVRLRHVVSLVERNGELRSALMAKRLLRLEHRDVTLADVRNHGPKISRVVVNCLLDIALTLGEISSCLGKGNLCGRQCLVRCWPRFNREC